MTLCQAERQVPAISDCVVAVSDVTRQAHTACGASLVLAMPACIFKQLFAVGDILRFVDGVKTHILNYSSSRSRYCQEEYERLLTVGGDGQLEVRALSWEIPERQTSFEVDKTDKF